MIDNFNLIGNHVYTRMLNLDLKQQKYNAYIMEKYIDNNFNTKEELKQSDTAWSFSVYSQYNYLLSPLPGMHALYNNIKETFYYSIQESESYNYDEYSIQCWLNVYKKGGYINWHSHWAKKWDAWHGFYCVDVEPDSYTTYRVKDRNVPNDDIKVESKNNLLILSKSGNDIHRSSEWNQEYPRITIAFDIVPTYNLFINKETFNLKNHWIPL